MIHSYPSIYALGHKAVADLLKGPVIVEEKIDGSQLSFGVYPDTGELEVRSKGAQINLIAPEKMFKRGVEYLQSIKDSLVPGLVYRGEYLNSPHHNALTYSRIPVNHIAVFDIQDGDGSYKSPLDKRIAASNLLLETVPVLFEGVISDPSQIREFLQTESVLGGQKIEGVVIKPASYDLYGRDKKVLMAKFVSEEYKEVHSATWKEEHGTKAGRDVLQILAASLATPARWQKALIHLRERGLITGELKDIGLLMAEIPTDVLKEEEENIKEALMKWAWPQLRRMITRGVPEFYKQELMKQQFEDKS